MNPDRISDATPVIIPGILACRGESVMLDSDLALLYGIETGQFTAIKRNPGAFQPTRLPTHGG